MVSAPPIPTTSKVILDWGHWKFFGTTRNYGAQGFAKAAGSHKSVEECHFYVVEIVLGHYRSDYERAICDHVRRVLDIEAESLKDLRRWPADVPHAVWLQFVKDCREARDRGYRSGS